MLCICKSTGVPGERCSLTGRSISGMMNQLCWYTSIRYISLTGKWSRNLFKVFFSKLFSLLKNTKFSITDSSAIYYSAPAFVAVLAFFMLGEKFGLYECTSVIITLVGVTLVSKSICSFNELWSKVSLLNQKRNSLSLNIGKPGFLPFFNAESSTDSQLTASLNDSTILKSISRNQSNITNSSALVSLTLSNDYITQTENFHVYGMLLAFIGAITFALSNIYVSHKRFVLSHEMFNRC